MSSTLMLDVEKKLEADQDGLYRLQLISSLEERREDFSRAKQGLLPPNEHQLAEAMEAAITAALEFIKTLKPAKNVSDPMSDGNLFSPRMNI